MPEPDLVRQPGRRAEDHRSVAGGLQYGTAAQQPGVSNPGGIRGGNRREKRLWKRRGVEKYKPLFHSAWESRKPGGIPTFPQPRRRRDRHHRASYRLGGRSMTWAESGGRSVPALLTRTSSGSCFRENSWAADRMDCWLAKSPT